MFKDEDDLTEKQLAYLHGECHIWALEHFKEGCKILAYTDFDTDINCSCLVHTCLQCDEVYLDIRGNTTSETKILEPFDYSEELDKVEFNSKKEFKEFLQSALNIKV